VVAGLALTAAPVAVLTAADNAHAEAKQTIPEKSRYEGLGGVFAIAAVVDHFSDAVVKNPIVGQNSKNPQLQEWHTKEPGKAARPQVHADAVGVQRFGWALPVHGH
jgi:hemoglobin